jgi:hypothetical protein
MAYMTQEDFNAALGPKVHGTINLDKAFASAQLDFFVMMSSLSVGFSYFILFLELLYLYQIQIRAHSFRNISQLFREEVILIRIS